jgi:hypothetical protein
MHPLPTRLHGSAWLSTGTTLLLLVNGPCDFFFSPTFQWLKYFPCRTLSVLEKKNSPQEVDLFSAFIFLFQMSQMLHLDQSTRQTEDCHGWFLHNNFDTLWAQGCSQGEPTASSDHVLSGPHLDCIEYCRCRKRMTSRHERPKAAGKMAPARCLSQTKKGEPKVTRCMHSASAFDA